MRDCKEFPSGAKRGSHSSRDTLIRQNDTPEREGFTMTGNRKQFTLLSRPRILVTRTTEKGDKIRYSSNNNKTAQTEIKQFMGRGWRGGLSRKRTGRCGKNHLELPETKTCSGGNPSPTGWFAKQSRHIWGERQCPGRQSQGMYPKSNHRMKHTEDNLKETRDRMRMTKSFW